MHIILRGSEDGPNFGRLVVLGGEAVRMVLDYVGPHRMRRQFGLLRAYSVRLVTSSLNSCACAGYLTWPFESHMAIRQNILLVNLHSKGDVFRVVYSALLNTVLMKGQFYKSQWDRQNQHHLRRT